MNRTAKTLVSSLFGAGLTLTMLTGSAAAQEVWLNGASECQIFRALSDLVPIWCARKGDSVVERVAPGKSRGLRTRGMQYHDGHASDDARAHVEIAAVRQANPPAERAINAHISFEFDSFELTEEARRALDLLASILNNELMQEQMIEIEGHADASGSDAYNLTLSQLRARSVRAYLIRQHQVESGRLPFVGKGERELYDPANPTAAVNRRVVFHNVSGTG